MSPTIRRLVMASLALVLWLTSSCGSDFEPASLLTTVRVLGVRSETPYVRPGASFTTDVLAHDGRADPASPMRLFWLKDVCLSPTDGLPGDCYRAFGRTYPAHQDLTALVTEGPGASFLMPPDALGTAPRPGTLPTALVFVAACAGHLEFVGTPAGYPDAVPFACVDAGGQRLGSDDFVFASFRLYVSADLTNANPTPTGLTLDGVPLPADQPLALPRCSAARVDDCPARKLAVVIADDQQEVDPTSAPPGTSPRREQVWSSFFVSAGKLESEALVLFNASNGRTPGATDGYRGPTEPGDVSLFVVTHDNRSGVSFQTFKLHAQ